MAFNRECLPLGFNEMNGFDVNGKSEYPIHTKYNTIREGTLLKLAHDQSGIKRDRVGKINMVFFYNDATNPLNDPKCWDNYFEKIKVVSKFKIKKNHR